MQTIAMRSASSEDIRSEARRATRTREGKGRRGTSAFGRLLLAKAPMSADHGSLVQVGSLFRER